LASELERFFSVYGDIFSIFLKMLKRKERKEYIVQNVEVIWKRIEEAQLFEKIKNISFPKKCFNGCLFMIKSIKKSRDFHFFHSALLKSIKFSKFFHKNSKEIIVFYLHI